MSKNKNEKKGWWSRHAWIVAILLTIIVIVTLVCLKCCNPVDNGGDGNSQIGDNNGAGEGTGNNEGIGDDSGNNDDTPAPHTHVWGEYVETTPGDCYVDSIWTATCTCGETTTMTKPATHHQPTIWTKDGETWHSSYCQCGEFKFSSPCEFIAAEVFYPDCENIGYTIFCCTECENMHMGDIVPARGHVWLEWVDGDYGQHKRNCENCSSVQTEDCFGGTADCENGAVCFVCDRQYTDPIGHDWSDWVDNGDGEHKRVCGNDENHVEYERHHDTGENPGHCGACDALLCGHGGKIHYDHDEDTHWEYCGVCSTPVTEKFAHQYEETGRVEYCTEEGAITYTCVCGSTKTETIPAIDHAWSDWVDNGDGEHKRVCGNDASHVEYERHFDTGENPGHCGTCDALLCGHNGKIHYDYDEDTHWEYCGVCSTPVTEKFAHQYEETDRVEYCTEEGTVTYTCVCGSIKTETIPAIDHAWGEWVSNEDGTHTRTCLTYSDHTETKECNCTSEIISQTCLENGYTKHTCEDCGYTYNDTITSMYGHDWSDWCSNQDGTHWRVCGNDETEIEVESCTDFQITVIVPISCNGPEEAEYRCKDCAYTYMVEGEGALDHVWEDWKYCDEQYHSRTCLSNTDHVYIEEHVYEEVSRDIHCEEDGTITYACVCGDSYSETIQPVGHDWGPWVAQADRTSLRTCKNDPTHTETMKVLAGNSVFVTTSTDMVLTVYQDVYEAYPGIYLEVSKPIYDANGNEISKEVEIISDVYKVEGSKVRFLYRNLVAKEMSVVVNVKVFSGEDEYLGEYDYSIRTYAENMLRKDQPMELKTLLVDMLNYGTAAQKYFKYMTDDLANKNLTEEELSWGTQEIPEMRNDEVLTKSEDENSIKLHGNAVSLENSVKLNIHFELGKHNLEDVNIIYTYLKETGEEKRIVVSAADATAIDTGYRYTFDNAGYGGMRTMVKISFEDKNTGDQIGDSVVCSIESYVAQKYEESTDENLTELLVAIMRYGDSASAYAKYVGM